MTSGTAASAGPRGRPHAEDARTPSAVDGRVWLVDPVDEPELEERIRALGEPAGVLQLLDRHQRGCAAWATRLGVQQVQGWEGLPAPFEALPVRDRRWWREVALWEPAGRTLVSADALGTVAFFRAPGERVGLHPLIRPFPPRALRGLEPARILVGHGEAVTEAAGEALQDTLTHARRRLPAALRAARQCSESRFGGQYVRSNGPIRLLRGHRAPRPRVARVASVVAHEEVVPGRHAPGAGDVVVFRVRRVRLVQALAVQRDHAVVLGDRVAGQADQALHERAALAALDRGLGRSGEDDDLPAGRRGEAVGEPVDDHAVAEARLAPGAGACAVQRRLHRRRRDAVRLRDLRFEDEHEGERDADRRDPIEDPFPGRHVVMVLRRRGSSAAPDGPPRRRVRPPGAARPEPPRRRPESASRRLPACRAGSSGRSRPRSRGRA